VLDPFDLLKNADECVSRAGVAANEEQRQILLETADAWRKLASEVARMNEFALKTAEASRAHREASRDAAKSQPLPESQILR
jgi:hypothetical protein